MIDLQSALFGGIAVLFIQLGICLLYFKSIRDRLIHWEEQMDLFKSQAEHLMSSVHDLQSLSEKSQSFIDVHSEFIERAADASVMMAEIIKEKPDENA